MRKPASALALGTVIVLAAGCGGTSSTSSTTAGTTGGASSGGNGGTTLNIVEKEFSLTPTGIRITKPGTYTINGINKGTISHGIAIDGQGVDKTGPVVGPGGTSTITVSITKPGKYDLFCPVGSHRQAGMLATLTLGSGSGSGSGGGMGGGTTTHSSGGYGY